MAMYPDYAVESNRLYATTTQATITAANTVVVSLHWHIIGEKVSFAIEFDQPLDNTGGVISGPLTLVGTTDGTIVPPEAVPISDQLLFLGFYNISSGTSVPINYLIGTDGSFTIGQGAYTIPALSSMSTYKNAITYITNPFPEV